MKLTKKVNALRVRQNLGQVLEEVFYNGNRYVIERAGRAMAAVVPLWMLEEYEQSRSRFYGMAAKAQARNRRVPEKTVAREIQEAVAAARSAKKRR